MVLSPSSAVSGDNYEKRWRRLDVCDEGSGSGASLDAWGGIFSPFSCGLWHRKDASHPSADPSAAVSPHHESRAKFSHCTNVV